MAKKPQNQPYLKPDKSEKSPDQKLRDDWLEKLDEEERINKPARAKMQKVVDRYRDDKRKSGSQFNILWANEQVLHGALYSATPKPDVRRRFLDSDPVSRETAAVLERAISFTVDNYDFDGTANHSVKDYLLTGIGQARVRYKPYFEKVEPFPVPVVQGNDGYSAAGELVNEKDIQQSETGELFVLRNEKKVYEEVTCEPVPWDRFRWQPGKVRWEDVQWSCIDHYLDKQEARDQFGDVADKLDYTHSVTDEKNEEKKNLAVVHEIFDKRKREVVVVSKGYKDAPVKKWDDPLNLVGFYPFPKPLFATLCGELMPIPDYHFYQDQAEELDRITARIDALVEMLKVRGVYDQSFEELKNVLRTSDGTLTPVKDFFARFADRGGNLEQAIALMPLKEIADVLVGLYQQRNEIKQTIYEITGIADIVRGQSDASETLGAQQLKGQFADMRLSTRRTTVNSFFRDVFRIKSEIIAEQFDTSTLKLMSGVDVTPQMDEILKSDVLRAYKIDVETESTMAVDAEAEQKSRTEALTGLTLFLEKAIPAVQAQIMPKELAKELALFVVRGFKRGRQLEDILERLGAENSTDPQALQMQIGQLQQQLQVAQQQMQEGSQYVKELEQKIDSKQIEEQSKTEREREKIAAEERMQSEKLAAEERMQQRDHSAEQRAEVIAGALREEKKPDTKEADQKIEQITQIVNELAEAQGVHQQAISQIMEMLQKLAVPKRTPSRVDFKRDKNGDAMSAVPIFDEPEVMQ